MAALLSNTAALGAAPSSSQTISLGSTTHVLLQAGQESEVEFSSVPQTVSIVEFHLHGGLIAIRSNEIPRWALDLGKGAIIRYASRSSAEGKTRLIISSIESARVAEIELQIVPANVSTDDLDRLHDAEIALSTADTARRRWPGAPTTTVALAQYDHAIELARQLHDIPLLRLCLTQKSRFLLFEKSNFNEARTLLKEAASLPPSKDTAQQALTYKTLASVEAYLANYDQSISAGKSALALYVQSDDRYWQGIVLGNLADSYDRAGQIAQASAAAHEALADAQAVQDAAGVVYCLGQIADIDRRQGQFDLALQAFRDALSWSKNISYAPLIQEEIERAEGMFYAQLGLWDEAELQLRKSLLHAQGRKNASSLEAQGVLADALAHKGKVSEALRQYTKAIELAELLHLPREQTMLRLRRSSLLLSTASPSSALADVDHAAQMTHDLDIPGLTSYVEIARGNIYASSSTPHAISEAKQAFQRAIDISLQMGDREQQAIALAGLARAQQRQGDLNSAINSIDQALHIVENSRSGLRNSAVAASYFAQYRLWYEFAVTTAMQRSQQKTSTKTSSDHDIRLAFQYAERMKARALLDTLTQDIGLPQPGLSSELSQRIDANRSAIEVKQSQLNTSGTYVAAIATALRQLYQEQDILSAEAHAAATTILSNNVEMAETIVHLQSTLLTPGSIYLSYTVGEQHSYRWMITPASVTVQTLPGRTQLARALTPLRRKLTHGRPTNYPGEEVHAFAQRTITFDSELQNNLFAVGTLLLRGIPSTTQTIYISAEEDLLSIPWPALRLRCHHQSCYAVEKFEISNEPSASVAVYLAEHPTQPLSPRIAVVANPLVADVPLAGTRFLPLPGADREASAIAQISTAEQTQILRGAQATPAAIESMMAQPFSVLHFATHTILVPQHSELSGIALSASKIGPRDGVLWLRDIRGAHISAPLVVLSSCDTQVSSETIGEGLNTLSQAFLFAGAHSVVGTLWKTDDDASVELMQHFYQNLLVRRMFPAAALRSAQLTLRNRYSNPLLWAAFVINGLPSQLPSQTSTTLAARSRP